MTILHHITHAGKRLFVHWHDAGEFKEEEHPRAKSGQFTKKGTGVSGGTKPKSAPNATIVNPIAKTLKEHGYEKQKGQNVFKHPSGHEVEVHAASEGQKWLTGWTHGTSGQTGSGAGKLDKHLQSLPHGGFGSLVGKAPPKEEPDPFEKKMAELSTYKPPPPPKTLADYPPMSFVSPKPTAIQAKPGIQHPLPKVHASLTGVLGFIPTNQNTGTTTYEHADKGKVVVKNKTFKSGIHKGQAYWEYFAKSGNTVPTKTGYGINNGQLQQAIQTYALQPQATPTPSTAIPPQPLPTGTTPATKPPSWAKYGNQETAKWSGIAGGEPGPAERYWMGSSLNPSESLVIGTGPDNKGHWQLWTKEDGVVAVGTSQESLNEEFEKLHPRGAGGQFIAKPDNVEPSAHKALSEAGYKPLGPAPWGSGDIHVYGKEDGSILLTKPLPNELKKSVFPPNAKALEGSEDLFTQMLGGKKPKVGTSIEVPEDTQPTTTPTISSASLESVLSPLKAKGFEITTGTSYGAAGQLAGDPNKTKMAFVYNPETGSGVISWQLQGETSAHTTNFNGTSAEFYNALNEEHTKATQAATPKAISHPLHLNDLTKVGEQKGSNPGGVYEDADGKKFYVKLPKTSEHASNELLAAELMSKVGGGTFKYHVVHDADGKLNVGTDFEALQKDNVSQLSPDERKQAQSDFAVNAWLANWDAAGTGGDNIGVLNGKVINLDLGGSLLYRAQGSPKGELFGNSVGEWDTLRSHAKNPHSAKLYADMTTQQLKDSAAKLKNISDKDIKESVEAWFPADKGGTELANKLIARRDDILQRAASLSTAPAAPPPPPEPVYTQANPGPKGHADPDGLRRKVAKWNPPGKPTTAIQAYKGSDYHEMNALMRFGALEDHDQSPAANYVRQTKAWLDKANIQEDLVVYRGVPKDVVAQWEKFAKVGRALNDEGFQSCSTSKQFSDAWHGGTGRTLRILIPKGTKAGTVRDADQGDSEYELLLQVGTKLRITSWQPGKYEVTVEQPHLSKGIV